MRRASFKHVLVVTYVTNFVLTLLVSVPIIDTSLVAHRTFSRYTHISRGNNEILEVAIEEATIVLEDSNEDYMGTNQDIGVNWYDEDDIYDDEKDILSSPYSDCGSPGVNLKQFSVSPCGGDPCVIRRGSRFSFNVTFVPKVKTYRLPCSLTAKWGLIRKKIDCPQHDACYASGMNCPLQIGKTYNYTISMSVSTKIPKFKYWVTGELKDDNGRTFMCLKVHVKVS
ncbi:Epididymal secretory protein E1 [Orchesella cincta]|uniref:Epididymal secretory protein E1 n=1 Tax=Orchesella cincta TaxID=48709 RepID=A0A1D2MHT3_ORCCI|nr:Epididymal secretory protein E1 [Orchesella cincta]